MGVALSRSRVAKGRITFKVDTPPTPRSKVFSNPTDQEPPFAPLVPPPGVGLDVLSPGNRAELTHDLKPGRYVLLCFMPDEKTGVPHAAPGMHKVVTVR